MTPSRSLAKRKSAEVIESGSEKSDRPYGMLPRLHGVEVDGADEDLALLLAEQLYPNLTHIDQIEEKRDKAWWVLVTGQLLRGHEAVTRYVESFSKVFQPAVDAQVDDVLRKGAAEELERLEQAAREIEIHKANLENLAQDGTLVQERWEMEKREREKGLELEEIERKTKLQLEKEEREFSLNHNKLRQRVGLGMAIITFCCALAAFIVGLASGEGWVIGGSTITGIAALVAVVKLLGDPPPPSEQPPANPVG